MVLRQIPASRYSLREIMPAVETVEDGSATGRKYTRDIVEPVFLNICA